VEFNFQLLFFSLLAVYTPRTAYLTRWTDLFSDFSAHQL